MGRLAGDWHDRRVDIVRKELDQPTAPVGQRLAELDQPTIVGTEPGPSSIELGPITRCAAQVGEHVEERRQRVRKDDLTTHALAIHRRQPIRAVPVGGVAGVVPWIDDGREPRVELVVQIAIQVVLVLRVLRARVCIGRQNQIAVEGIPLGHGCSFADRSPAARPHASRVGQA